MGLSPVYEGPVVTTVGSMSAPLERVVVFFGTTLSPPFEDQVKTLPPTLSPVLEEQVLFGGSTFGPVLEGGPIAYSDGIDGRQFDDVERIPAIRFQKDSLTADEIADEVVTSTVLQDDSVTPEELDRTYLRTPFFLSVSPAFFRAQAGVTPPLQSVIADEDAIVFPPASERGGRFAFTIPSSYDDTNPIEMRLVIRNPGAPGGNPHLVETAYRINGSALSTPVATPINPVGTTQGRTDSVLSLPAGLVAPGDTVMVQFKRLGDSEPQDLEVYRFIIRAPVSL